MMDQDLEVGSSVQLETSAGGMTQLSRHKRKKSQWCSAINCKNGRYENPGLSFFRFPRDEERCKQWLLNCRREDLYGKSPKELFRSNVLCAIHFEDSQFTNAQTKNRLKPLEAVPTLFKIPNPLAENAKQDSTDKYKKRTVVVAEDSPKPSPSPFPAQDSTGPPEQTTALTTLQEKYLQLKRKVDSQRKCIKRLQSGLSTARKQKQELAIIKSLSAKYLRQEVHEFFCTQLDMSVSKGKRWKAHNKRQALSMYHASPKAYPFLRKIFQLPSVTTMRRMMAIINLERGHGAQNEQEPVAQKVDAMRNLERGHGAENEEVLVAQKEDSMINLESGDRAENEQVPVAQTEDAIMNLIQQPSESNMEEMCRSGSERGYGRQVQTVIH